MAKKKKKPLWKMDDGITFSALSSWSSCPEQFSLSWIEGLTKKKLSIPLEFGNVIHYCLQYQDKGDPDTVVRNISKHYRDYRSTTISSSSERDFLNLILGLAEVVFPRYCRYWAADDAKMEWIGREEKFKIPYKIVDLNNEVREIVLRGMRDGLYSRDNGTISGLFETKTKSKIIETEIMSQLQYDMQTFMYCLCTGISTGYYPTEICYNVIRRPDLYKPTRMSIDKFLNKIADDIDLRPEHYFIRYKASVTQEELEDFQKKTLDPILKLFIQWWDSIKKNPLERWDSPFHSLNSINLVGRYGKADMWDAIFGNLRPYRIRSEVFPELEESFQVTWD